MPASVITKPYDANWRDCVWKLIRKLREFTRGQLDSCQAAHPRAITDYVNGLARAGYIERRGAVFHLVNDIGAEAPMLHSNGRAIEEHRLREQVWRTVKLLAEFSVADMVVHGSTEEYPLRESFTKHYLDALANAGYVARIARAPGQRIKRYRALPSACKGPKPPLIQYVMQVFDPNTGGVVWRADAAQEDADASH